MDGKVYTLSLADGGKIWEFDTGSPVEALPLLVKKVYIGSMDGLFYALDAGNGELKWKYETGNQIAGSGKSTLLNIMGTLDHPTSGSVTLGSMELSGLPKKNWLK